MPIVRRLACFLARLANPSLFLLPSPALLVRLHSFARRSPISLLPASLSLVAIPFLAKVTTALALTISRAVRRSISLLTGKTHAGAHGMAKPAESCLGMLVHARHNHAQPSGRHASSAQLLLPSFTCNTFSLFCSVPLRRPSAFLLFIASSAAATNFLRCSATRDATHSLDLPRGSRLSVNSISFPSSSRSVSLGSDCSCASFDFSRVALGAGGSGSPSTSSAVAGDAAAGASIGVPSTSSSSHLVATAKVCCS
mmetsp:Transcript_48826/g.121109  ORF Transcript_48826/g.121109 Transcript_48826/m.121109 type:complete len:254 (-) Transcript_48826:1022-1783(-)